MASVQNQDDAKFFNDRGKEISKCSHAFVVSNWVKTEKSQNASQLVCQQCLAIVTMETIMKRHARFLAFAMSQNPET